MSSYVSGILKCERAWCSQVHYGLLSMFTKVRKQIAGSGDRDMFLLDSPKPDNLIYVSGAKIYRKVRKLSLIAKLGHGTIGKPSRVKLADSLLINRTVVDLSAAEVSESSMGTVEAWVDREFSVAATSLATAVGSLVFPPLALISGAGLIYLSLDFVQKAYTDLVKKRRFTSLALEAFFLPLLLLSGHLILAAVTYWLFYVYLRIVARVKGQTVQSLTGVFGEQPQSVWIDRAGTEVEIPFADIQPGDVVIIRAGETIPIDGTIVAGIATIDQRLLTGESQPVEKGVSEATFAATLLLAGSIRIQTAKAGTETLAAQIGRVLKQTTRFASSLELRGIAIADRWALPNLVASALAYPIAGATGAMAILYVPLGDVLYFGGPLTLFNYLSIAAKQGILIKDGRALESLAQVDTIVFDKTGTLTHEQPHVHRITCCAPYTEDEILTYAATAEVRQTHPIARAILQHAKAQNIDLSLADEVTYEVGYGLNVQINNQQILVGSEQFMVLEDVVIPTQIRTMQANAQEEGHALVYVAINQQLGGIIELRATIRPETKASIRTLQQRNYALAILSGDHAAPTRALAEELGIDQYFAEVLPEQKSEFIAQLQAEGRSVCFIGDGINDAIALKQAQVSISLAGASTIAMDTAQIILMDGTLQQLIPLLDLAQEIEASMKRTLWVGWVPSLLCIGGVFFLHLGLGSSVVLYYLGLTGGFANAMWPLLAAKVGESDAMPG